MLFRHKNKEVVSNSKFASIGEFVDGIAVAKLSNGKYVYVNKNNDIVSREYLYARPFSCGMSVVRVSEGADYILINQKFEFCGDTYDYIINNFKDGYATVCTFNPNVESYFMRNGTYYSSNDVDIVMSVSKLIREFDVSENTLRKILNDFDAIKAVEYECKYRMSKIDDIDFGYSDKQEAYANLKEIQKDFRRRIDEKEILERFQ